INASNKTVNGVGREMPLCTKWGQGNRNQGYTGDRQSAVFYLSRQISSIFIYICRLFRSAEASRSLLRPVPMSSTPKVTELLNRLHTPPQDLAQLSFCKSTPGAIKAWVDALPLTQMNFVSTQLYRALLEIARLKVSPEVRLAMLEHLRSPTQQTIQGLSQSFLNQPLILPEAARKTATVAQALQKHMSNGYLAVVREL